MQMADEVPESSGRIAKNLPRSSKLLGIIREFIFLDSTCAKVCLYLLVACWGSSLGCIAEQSIVVVHQRHIL